MNSIRYIFGGRFQPFHIGHLAVLNHLAKRHDATIVLGVIHPDPERPFPGDERKWVRFSVEDNPLSYWERLEIIKKSLDSEPCAKIISGIVPLPRPSVNLARAENYLPGRPRSFVLCQKWDDEIESWKAKTYRGIGEDIHMVNFAELHPMAQIASGDLIRCLMRVGNPAWKIFAAPSSIEYLESERIFSKITQHVPLKTAEAFLERASRDKRYAGILSLVGTPLEYHHSNSLHHDHLATEADLFGALGKIVEKTGKVTLNVMGDIIKANQIIGAVGNQAHVDSVHVTAGQNLMQDVDQKQLIVELGLLEDALRQKTTDQSQDDTVHSVAGAKDAAKTGDYKGVIQFLKRSGMRALKVAEEIGTKVAAEAIKKSIGL